MKWWWIPVILVAIAALIWWKTAGNPDNLRQTKPSTEPTQSPWKDKSEPKKSVSKRDTPKKKDATGAPQPANRKPAREKGKIYSIAEFEKKYPGRWKFNRRATGAIQSITGALIKEVGRNTDSILDFAQTLTPLLAEGDYQLSSESRVVANTDLLRSFDMKQFTGGFEVYQGSLQMLSRNSDGSVYIINNRLRDVTEFKNTPDISVEQGEKVILEKYSDAEVTRPMRPKVFALRGQTSQLAWIYKVVRNQPRHSHKDIVVSAVDGQILYEEEYTIHD